ncbi:MAG: hypothetical protein HY608_00035 [Planctomycetes bacterium]|nr:hypothetical protein [Planctomycetota bacterium]
MNKYGSTISSCVLCPIKVNLYLRVVGKRPDGYHDIESVFDVLEGEDELRFAPGPGRRLVVEGDAPPAPDNLVWKAWGAWEVRTGAPWTGTVTLTKRTPSGAGLGGGSGDAAAMLSALARLTRLPSGLEEARSWAATLGSDVPALMRDGPSWVTGRGEHVEPLPTGGPRHYVIVWPGFTLSTAAVYARWVGEAERKGGIVSRNGWETLLATGDTAAIARAARNDLDASACAVEPRLDVVRRALEPVASDGVAMTGSGSAFFLSVDGSGRAEGIARALRCEGAGWRVWTSRPVGYAGHGDAPGGGEPCRSRTSR